MDGGIEDKDKLQFLFSPPPPKLIINSVYRGKEIPGLDSI